MEMLMLGVDADKSSLTNAWHRFWPKMMSEGTKKTTCR